MMQKISEKKLAIHRQALELWGLLTQAQKMQQEVYQTLRGDPSQKAEYEVMGMNEQTL
jgi:hypothetical protein